MASSSKFGALKLGESDKKSKTDMSVFSVNMLEHKNKKTEMYVKFAKIMLMCQGPYSTSRANVTEKILEKFKYASYLISDETFTKHTKISCTYDRTEEFYDFFRNETQKALEEGNNLVVLDPTMSTLRQNQYYLALAYKMQYVFLVIPPVVTKSSSSWPYKSLAFSFREQGTFIQSSSMFKHLFCAWYLHDIDSLELRHLSGLYAQDCMENIPEFSNIFSRICPSDPLKESESDDSFEEECKSSSSSPSCTPESFNKYFKLNEQRQDLAYCVLKICPDLKSMNEYFKKEIVLENYGKMSKLLIVGFIVSPYMVAARVKLTHNQKDLWEIDDDFDENTKIELLCPSEYVEQSKTDLPPVQVHLISSKSNQTLINTRKVVHEPTEVIHPFSLGRSCHFVLGKAPGAPKRNIDYDVAFALKRERSIKNKEDIIIHDLERCVVKRIGKYWFIYLKEIMSVDGFFASCCKPFAYENAIVH